MDYSFFLFSKLYDLKFKSDAKLEYDILFEKVLHIYSKWKEWDILNGIALSEYESMDLFLTIVWHGKIIIN
jgi:hypothetical protein